MLAREKNLYEAQLADQAKRYDEVLVAIKKVVSAELVLNFEERSLLAVAYKKLIEPRRLSWRTISCIERKEKDKGAEVKAAISKSYRKKIEKELHDICSDFIEMLDKYLIPSASTGESKVIYYTLKGDYCRYMAEILNGSDHVDAADKAQIAYEVATHFARRDLSPTHPYSLALALNFSVFNYEILHLTDEGYRMARAAYDAVNAELDNLSDEFKRTCTLIMHFLRNNLTLWRMAGEVADDGEENEDVDPTETTAPAA